MPQHRHRVLLANTASQCGVQPKAAVEQHVMSHAHAAPAWKGRMHGRARPRRWSDPCVSTAHRCFQIKRNFQRPSPFRWHHGPLLPSLSSPAVMALAPLPPPPFCFLEPPLVPAGCLMPARERASRTPRAPSAGLVRGLGRSPGALSCSAADAAAAAAAIARSLIDAVWASPP